MRLEVGKTYKNGFGQDVKIVSKGMSDCTFNGEIESEGCGGWYHANGTPCFLAKSDQENLIIPEEKKPDSEDMGQQEPSKYDRSINCKRNGDGATIDVYEVLEAFEVTCPARQHAIKKLLCSGLRGKGDILQDLREAHEAVLRAVEMQEVRES